VYVSLLARYFVQVSQKSTWYQSPQATSKDHHQHSFAGTKDRNKATGKMESMFYSSTILLTPHNYLEWKPKILLLLRSRGLYQITMEMEVEPDSTDEKNDFLNRQDMAIGCICMSISPEIFHQVDDESQDSTPNELWTRLEVLFGNKERLHAKG
jgi:hypothetical protein